MWPSRFANVVGVSAEPANPEAIDAYRLLLGDGWDELAAPSGLHADQELIASAINTLGIDGLLAARQEMAELIADEGITYGTDESSHWLADPLPLVLGAQEWDQLEAGLRQRARLLGLILADIYGEQKLLSSGALPAEIVWAHPAFLHQACGVPVPGDRWLPLTATDLARGADGRWRVFADRTGTVVGAGYAMANRRLTSRVMRDLHHEARPARLRTYFSALRAGLQQLAPTTDHTPRGVLLWAGASSDSAYEQGFLATLLGYALVEAEDLVLRDGQVWLNSPEGRTLVDVIMRRVESSYSDPLEFRSDSQLGLAGLLEATRLGNVVTVNPLGSGVLENPALLGRLHELAPQLLGEELILGSPETWWCGDDAERSHVVENLDTLLLKPLGRSQGGVTRVGWELSRAEREELRARIEAEPWAWCGQRAIEPSTTPVVTADGVQPARFVLRTFGAQVEESHEFLAGGLARVSTGPEFRINNLSGALAKDVWVLDPDDVAETWMPTFEGGPVVISRVSALAPRVANNLYWLGRYAERADGAARLLRRAVDLADDHAGRPDSLGAQVLSAILLAGEKITGLDLSSDDVSGALKRLQPAIADRDLRGSVANAVRKLSEAAHEVPDIMSADLWHVLGQLDRSIQAAAHRRDLSGVLEDLLSATLAVAGINQENLTRDVTWAFVDAGTRIERAQRTLAVVLHTLGTDRAAVVESQLVDAVLELSESLITQRRRAASGEGPRQPALAAAQLLVVDTQNPRSVANQLDRLAADLELIGDEELAQRVRDLAMAEVDLGSLFAGPRRHVAEHLSGRLADIRDISDELVRRHLTRSAPRRATLSGWGTGEET